MNAIRWAAGLMAVVVSWSGVAMAGPPPTPTQNCEAKKNEVAGSKAACLMKERSMEVQGAIPNYGKCHENFMQSYPGLERKAGPGVCATEGDAPAIEVMVDVCMADIAQALTGRGAPPNPGCPPAKVPATGQMRCWDSKGKVIECKGTGQDGDIRAGAGLSYKDNGDGTITDNNTGLMWEKKSDDGSIHDKDLTYTWDEAFVYVAGLNAMKFAQYTDWRLPNAKELVTIVNYEKYSPAISEAFDTGCKDGCTVLTCSCTVPNFYWSSTSAADDASNAWYVLFQGGFLVETGKERDPSAVRAVRGGL